MTRFRLVGNNGYTVQDNPEPEEWVRPIVRAGLHHLEFFADHMDPVIFENVIRSRSEYFQATLDTIREHDLRLVSVTTGRISYLLNVLNHPYPDARREGMRWCQRMVDLAAALGAPYASGHFDYISQKDLRERQPEAAQRIIDGMVELAEYAAQVGLRGLCLEQMHGPQLLPYTIAEGQRMIEQINERSAVPVYMMCDTGHMAHVPPEDPNHRAEDKDPYAWLSRRYAGLDTVFVHTQQTDRLASRHWPFTSEHDADGIIDPASVVEAIEQSGVANAYLSFEILWGRGAPLEPIARDIAESADRFRAVLRDKGYALEPNSAVWEPPSRPSAGPRPRPRRGAR